MDTYKIKTTLTQLNPESLCSQYRVESITGALSLPSHEHGLCYAGQSISIQDVRALFEADEPNQQFIVTILAPPYESPEARELREEREYEAAKDTAYRRHLGLKKGEPFPWQKTK